MSFPVKSSQGSELIGGVPAAIHISVYADRVLIIVTCTGKPGTLIATSRDRTVSGTSTFTVRVLLGKREDFFTVVARKIAELVGETCSKPVLVSLSVPAETPEVFRGVMGAVAKHKAGKEAMVMRLARTQDIIRRNRRHEIQAWSAALLGIMLVCTALAHAIQEGDSVKGTHTGRIHDADAWTVCQHKLDAIRLLSAGDRSRALDAFSRAAAGCGVTDAQVYQGLGECLYSAGMRSHALAAFKAAARLQPHSADMLNNVAAVLIDLERFHEAVQVLYTARLVLLQQAPQLLRDVDARVREASDSGGGASAATWTDDGVRGVRSTSMQSTMQGGRYVQMQTQAGRAAAEGMWKTLINLASALAEVNAPEHSARALRYASSLDHITWDRTAVASMQLYFLERRLCMWDSYVNRESSSGTRAADIAMRQAEGLLDSLGQAALPVDPYLALSLPVSPSEYLALARHYASLTRPSTHYQITASHTTTPSATGSSAAGSSASGVLIRNGVPPSTLNSRRGLIVAYASSEFGRRHSLMLLMRSVFSKHASVTAVCFVLQSVRPGVPPPACAGGVIDVSGESDVRAAQMMNEARAHVLVDLNGWTAGHRAAVIASRPCALQMHYMGFPATSGASFLDFAVLDRIVSPPDFSRHYSEKLVLLRPPYFVSDYASIRTAPAPVENGHVTHRRHVICNHDSFHKFDRVRFSMWLDAARRSGATLELLQHSRDAEQRLQARAAIDGVHVVFAERLGVQQHLQRIRECQVAVDTDGIGGHTTAANYLYAGVPVVTHPTDHQVGRVAASVALAIAQECSAAAVSIVRHTTEFAQVVQRLADTTKWFNVRSEITACLRNAAQDNKHVWDVQAWVQGWEAALALAVQAGASKHVVVAHE